MDGKLYIGKRTVTSKVANYTAYVTYKGEVSKETPGKATYAVVYRGELIPVPVVEPVPEPVKNSNAWLFILVEVLLIGSAILFIFLKKRGTFNGLALWEDDEDYDDFDEDVIIPFPPFQSTATPIEDIVPQEFEAVPFMPAADEAEPEDSGKNTADNILSAITGMDDEIKPKPKRRGSTRKDGVPLVVKLEENKYE